MTSLARAATRLVWLRLLLAVMLVVAVAGKAADAHPVSPASGHALIDLLLRREISQARVRGGLQEQNQRLVRLEVTSQRDVAGDIRSLGGIVEADIAGRILGAEIPVGKISRLAAIPGITELYGARQLHPLLDRSVPEIRANQVWGMTDRTGLPIQGNHVLVGLVDSGIDLHNPDFQNLDGTTRIKALWDQTGRGTPPSGFTFGNECTSAMINAGSCDERDTDGHGTHVAGIAAGNGRSSAPAREIGVAPEADLVVVKSDLSTDSILAAWQYLIGKAQQWGEPIVINNSFGSMISPHDGSAPDSLAVDRLSGPGRIFVAAAGNEGDQAMHTDGTVSQGQQASISFTLLGNDVRQDIGVFYSAQDSMSFKLTNTATGESWSVPAGGNLDNQTSRDGSTKVSLDAGSWNGKYSGLIVTIQSTSGDSLSGQYRLQITGDNVVDSGRFDAWMQEDQEGSFARPDESDTINDPGDAHTIIAVGNYATRTTWVDEDNQQHDICELTICRNGTLQVGDIEATSSLGPTADGRQKPDIAAPGTVIISSLSHDMPICSGPYSTDTCMGRLHVLPGAINLVAAGTSMSSPHVAGVIALMLQVNPYLDPQAVDSILRSTARHDQFTGNDAWTPSFGAGKVDALAAVQAVRVAPVATPPPTATPTPVIPLSFSFLTLRPEKSNHSTFKRIKAGQHVILAVYVKFSSLPDGSRVTFEWRVASRGDVVGYQSDTETLAHTDVGTHRAPWTFTPHSAGRYTVLGKVSVNGTAQTKTLTLTVRKR